MKRLPPLESAQLGSFAIGQNERLAVIAGPCVLEGEDFNLRHAERLASVAVRFGLPFVFKASFDKANRTKGGSFRGPGLQEGLRMLERVKAEVGVPVCTDVHLPEQCPAAGQVVDVLQIPAFLCRQTDLLTAAGETGRVVNVKKGQFLAPEDMGHAVEKVLASRPTVDIDRANVLVTERGTTFGYRDLIVDFRSLSVMRRYAPVVFDGTHAVQRPGSGDGSTGGDRTLAPPLLRAAVAYGVDAVYMEVHPDPDRAPSDGPNSLNLPMFESTLSELARIDEALR